MSNDAWRVDENGQLDDIVVRNIKMFRMERMNLDDWWICLIMPDGREIHMDLNLTPEQGVILTRRED